MKTTLLLTTYNRPAYLKRCLDSLRRASIKDILIIDDCSTDADTLNLISTYPHIRKQQRTGICNSLLLGIERAFDNGAEIVVNLDADALVRNDFLERILELHEAFPYDLITGFHSTTKNRDGSERHEVICNEIINLNEFWNSDKNLTDTIKNTKTAFRKRSVGGINMLWTRFTWNKYKLVIENSMRNNLNWDHQVSLASPGIVCPTESLVQHIGVESSMNHIEQPDVADTFRILNLPNVTLIGVDGYDAKRLHHAMIKATKDIIFGSVKILSSQVKKSQIDEISGFEQINIKPINSTKEYSAFIVKDLYKYIETDYALIMQHDGYPVNAEAWSNDFFSVDYIGAPWHFHKDELTCGNGGFSLRSKKFLETCAKDDAITELHPEDHVLCRTYRRYLENKYALKYASKELAYAFSIEGYGHSFRYSGQFGFHGKNVIF